MRDTERSGATFAGALVVAALLAATFLFPWFLYSYSSGQLAPSGGPQGDQNYVEKERLAFYPFHFSGNASTDHPGTAKRAVEVLGYLLSGQIGLIGLAFLLEVPVAVPFETRRWTLALCVLAFVLGVAALAWSWIVFPGTMDGHGVTGAFTSRTTSNGYVITRLDWGWAMGALGTALLIPLFALRFQTGTYDPSIVESYAAPKSP